MQELFFHEDTRKRLCVFWVVVGYREKVLNSELELELSSSGLSGPVIPGYMSVLVFMSLRVYSFGPLVKEVMFVSQDTSWFNKVLTKLPVGVMCPVLFQRTATWSSHTVKPHSS